MKFTGGSILLELVVVLAFTVMVSYFFPKPMRGMDIVMSPFPHGLTPRLHSPILRSLLLIHAVGYSSSVLGSLIGAGLLHPRRSRRSTTGNQHKWCHEFDGMFVSRLLSLFLAYFILLVLRRYIRQNVETNVKIKKWEKVILIVHPIGEYLA